jgi:hypothetical protein
MNDALCMGGFERFGHLASDVERLRKRQRSAPDAPGEVLTLDELHHQRVAAVHLLEPVDRANVRMIERGEHARFSFEAHDVLALVSKRAREDFDRDVAAQPCVASAIDLAHPARADHCLDFEDADATSCQRRRQQRRVRRAIRCNLFRMLGARLRPVAHDLGCCGAYAVLKGRRFAVAAQQRLDFITQGGIDVMFDVVNVPLDRRSVGEFAKECRCVGMHGAREAPGPPRRTLYEVGRQGNGPPRSAGARDGNAMIARA